MYAWRYECTRMYIDIWRYVCVCTRLHIFIVIKIMYEKKTNMACKYWTYLDMQEIICMTSSYSVIDFVATPATLSPITYHITSHCIGIINKVEYYHWKVKIILIRNKTLGGSRSQKLNWFQSKLYIWQNKQEVLLEAEIKIGDK